MFKFYYVPAPSAASTKGFFAGASNNQNRRYEPLISLFFNMKSMAKCQYHAVDKLVCFVNVVFQRKYSTHFKVLVPSCNLIANEASLFKMIM